MTTSYLGLTRYCLYIEKFGFFSNAIFGSLLVYFTIFCIKRQFGSYKKLLVNFQIIGFIFASFDFIFPTLLHTYNNALVYFTFPNPFFSNSFLKLMIGAYTAIFSATICLLAIQFLYRYWAVFDASKLKYFNGFCYFIWISYYTFFGFLWAFAVVYFFALDDYGEQYLAEEIRFRYKRKISEIPILSLISYDNEGKIRWRSLCGLLTITGISVVQYSIITVCAYKMYGEMKEKLSKMSPLHRRIHRQFYKALLIQHFLQYLYSIPGYRFDLYNVLCLRVREMFQKIIVENEEKVYGEVIRGYYQRWEQWNKNKKAVRDNKALDYKDYMYFIAENFYL